MFVDSSFHAFIIADRKGTMRVVHGATHRFIGYKKIELTAEHSGKFQLTLEESVEITITIPCSQKDSCV